MITQIKFTSIFLFIFLFASCTNTTKPERKDKTITQDVKQINTYDKDSIDIEIFNKIIEHSKKEHLSEKTISEITIAVAKFFLSTPYVAKTLEKDGNEHLIINLQELDCTTFVENIVSFSTCIKNETTNFDAFCQTLTTFRYRNGKIEEYPSRLHYFTEWLYDNEQK